jgi:protein required for attachment to host cells
LPALSIAARPAAAFLRQPDQNPDVDLLHDPRRACGRQRRARRIWMTKLKIKQDEWVVVCDGTKALILQNAGDEMFPNLQTRDHFQQDDPPTRDQGSAPPGRIQQSVGHGSSAVEQTDWHLQAEEGFLEKLMKRLDQAVMAGRMKSLIIVAPPRALGIIRRHYSHALRGALRAEVDKDLVKMPVHEIEKHLAA